MEFLEGKTVGIDLGTTFSTLAIVDEQGEPTQFQTTMTTSKRLVLSCLQKTVTSLSGQTEAARRWKIPKTSSKESSGKWSAVGYQRQFDARHYPRIRPLPDSS